MRLRSLLVYMFFSFCLLALNANAIMTGGPIAKQTVDLICDNYVEQDNFLDAFGPGLDGATSTDANVQGLVISCHSTDPRYGNILSGYYHSSGGEGANVFTETTPGDCTTIVNTQGQITVHWNNHKKSVISFSQNAEGIFTAYVSEGLFKGDTLTVPTVAGNYATLLGPADNLCSSSNPGGVTTGYYINPWIPGSHGVTWTLSH